MSMRMDALRIIPVQFGGNDMMAHRRMIYSAPGEITKREIHALNIQVYTLDEI